MTGLPAPHGETPSRATRNVVAAPARAREHQARSRVVRLSAARPVDPAVTKRDDGAGSTPGRVGRMFEGSPTLWLVLSIGGIATGLGLLWRGMGGYRTAVALGDTST